MLLHAYSVLSNNMGIALSTIREDTRRADRETRLEVEERLKLLEKMVHSRLEKQQLLMVAEGSGDQELICTGMVVDVLKKVNIVMSSSKENSSLFLDELINESFFVEVKLRGLDKLINFEISKVSEEKSVGEHSVNHMIILPTNLTPRSFLRCDVYSYRWNFASKGIIKDMEGVVGILLLKRVIDVTKTDHTLLDSNTMRWTSDSPLGHEFVVPELETESEIESGSEVEEVVTEKPEERMTKRKTSRWKRRRRAAGVNIKRILGPEKRRERKRKSGKYEQNYGVDDEDMLYYDS